MIEVQNWGLIDYQTAWDKQKELVSEIQVNRNKNVLVLCTHPSVITIGKSGHDSNVLPSTEFLNEKGIQVIKNNRGGDVTLHNPGQLVAYPIFNLSMFKEDLHWFLREIEQIIIELIAEYGLVGGRVEGLTGVWLENSRKICAMGLNCSRWVTSHGLALNANNDISEFDYIIPCGITDKAVTSIAKELNHPIDFAELEMKCERIFRKHFDHF